MPTSTDIIKAIAEHLALSPQDLDREALLKEELELGPIELNDLVGHLAQQFNVTFEADEVKNLKKVGDLISLVEDNLLD